MITLALIILACTTIALCVSLGRSRLRIHQQDLEIEHLKLECENAKHESDAKELFVQNMSHEVRTPLNAVVGFAQLLAMPPEFLTQEERTEYGEHIQHNSNMLTMLIDDILNISDVKTGNYTINPASHSLHAICNTALASVKYRVKANIALRYETTIDENYTVYADARRIQQILINYLTNAIKHTQVGSITLSTSLDEHPGMITFAVTDTGEGVPVGQAKNVFRRFTKLNDFVQGTGLGLNICLTLADKMNGQVFLDTSYIKGARFVFCFPIEETKQEEVNS